ncbi:hypothetical protein AC249_AIPGENE6476 [Exaiptasia diaphana]|nr:hypothetical protein AC249_AIPGENE6476 [Exaiptasia diaphana]
MVLCLFVGCHARSGRDKDVSFYRVPAIDRNHGEQAEELSIERRRKWLAAISRDGLTEQILKNDRVCSRHFVSGRAAKSWDRFNWVRMLNLGHSKRKVEDNDGIAQRERAERAKARRKKKLEEQQAAIETSLWLNEEGILVSDIPFMPSSDDFGTQTAETAEVCSKEVDVCSAEEDMNENDKFTQTEVKNFVENFAQTDSVRRSKCYDAVSQTEEFDYIYSSDVRINEFDEDYFKDSDDKDGDGDVVTGHNLRELLSGVENHLAWCIRLKIIDKCASAVKYLHEKLIVHGDLKSSNVLINGQSQETLDVKRQVNYAALNDGHEEEDGEIFHESFTELPESTSSELDALVKLRRDVEKARAEKDKLEREDELTSLRKELEALQVQNRALKKKVGTPSQPPAKEVNLSLQGRI